MLPDLAPFPLEAFCSGAGAAVRGEGSSEGLQGRLGQRAGGGQPETFLGLLGVLLLGLGGASSGLHDRPAAGLPLLLLLFLLLFLGRFLWGTEQLGGLT